jgi:hypothetical protein
VAAPAEAVFSLACPHGGFAWPANTASDRVGICLGPIFAGAGEGDYLQFLAPGIITMGILFTAVFSGIEIIWDRQFGFLKETLVAPVSRLEVGHRVGRLSDRRLPRGTSTVAAAGDRVQVSDLGVEAVDGLF